jgi:polyhydroxybutyrate depolymerase
MNVRRARLGTAGLLALLLLACGCVRGRAQTSDREISLESGGRTRTCVVHVPPSYASERPVPLVLLLHGGGGNGAQAATAYGMNPIADREGFIVAYPNGTSAGLNLLTWNAANCCSYAYEHQVDDVGFIAALIDEMSRQYAIDARRIYVTGMSNGAMMTYRLGCQLADRIAAIAPVSGSLNDTACAPPVPLPVIIFHGTDDQHVLYNGGYGPHQLSRHYDNPVSYAVSFWVSHDGCNPTPQTVTSPSGNIVTNTYSSGRGNSEVVLYTIRGGGHAWPGGMRGSYPGADEPTQEISASELMWEFFKRHPKPAAPATVRVTSPNGGETVRRGDTVRIAWMLEGPADVASQEIALSADSGATFTIPVAAGLDPSARSFAWTVPDSLPKGKRYRVRVTAGDASDASDADFRVRRGPR